MILNFVKSYYYGPYIFINNLTVRFNTFTVLSRFISKSVFIYAPVEFTLQYVRCVPEIVFNVLQDR